MNQNRRNSIAKKVHTLLEDNGVAGSPVPVDRLARAIGAKLRYSPLDEELSGMVYIKEGLPIIGVNALHHPNRQRFTIAHECGHLVLHKAEITREIHVDKDFPMLMRNTASSTGVEEMEVEANFFAAEFLMPEPFIAQAVGNKPFDIDDESAVSALAKEFKVSPSAMRFRLGNLLG